MKSWHLKSSKESLDRNFGSILPICFALLILGVIVQVSPASAQPVLFDFDSAPIHTSLPISQTVNGLTANLSGTGQGYSIQDANVLGFTPQGFSGLVIYPNSIYLADLLIRFDQPITYFSIMYSVQELACDTSATMRVTAYFHGGLIGTDTKVARIPGTWPVDTLSCSFPQGFDSVVVHYDSHPPACQDYGVIFMADNMQATPLATAQPAGWSIQSSPTANNLYGVASSRASIWVAVGDAGTILRSSDGGFQWTSVSSPVTDALRAIGLHGNAGLAVGIAGRVLRTTDGGLNWTEETRPTTRALYSVAVGNGFAIATGEEGTILVSPDTGLTWTPHGAGTASVLFGVSIFDSTAVGVGGQGAIVMSPGAGSGWGLTVLGGQLTFFYGTSFASRTTGWAVGTSNTIGSLIIKSTNSGFVWSAQTAPTTDQLFGVSFATPDSGWAVGGNGTILQTSDGGTNWVIDTSGTTQVLNAVSFADSRTGVAVGNAGTILRTISGGVTSVGGGIHFTPPLPNAIVLEQNYPNPFNPETDIRFTIPEHAIVTLTVVDVLGRVVATLLDGPLAPGSHFAHWDAKGTAGGVYFYRLQANNRAETKKLVLLR
jgi:photosystem II stability/assembly factor-like uncharacterized protein